jgi:hypothetical protein
MPTKQHASHAGAKMWDEPPRPEKMPARVDVRVIVESLRMLNTGLDEQQVFIAELRERATTAMRDEDRAVCAAGGEDCAKVNMSAIASHLVAMIGQVARHNEEIRSITARLET